MATIDTYKIKIQVDGKDEVLDLNNQVDKLSTTLNRAATAGIAAFAALGASAIKMAANMDDVAKATGLATGDIYKLAKALEISGGEFNDSGNVLRAFSKALGQVETGSKDTIDALTKLGISRQELENLSDQELFNRVVSGLGNMKAGFERTQIAMELLGKGAASLDFKKLSDELQKASDPEVARRFELAGDALDNISSAFRELQAVALQVLEPILTQLAQFQFTAEDARKAIQVLGALIAAAFAASVVLQMTKIIELFKTMGQVIRGAAAAQAFMTGMTGVGLAAVAASAAAATAAYVALGKAMEGASDEKAKLEGDATAAPATQAGTAQRKIGQTPEEKALATIKAQTIELQKKNAEANKYQATINSTIGMSEREAAIIRSNADLERQATNDKLAIQKQIDVELAKGKDSNAAIVAELRKQLVEVDAQLRKQKELKQQEIDRLQELKNVNQRIAQISQEEITAGKILLDKRQADVDLLVAQGLITEKQAERQKQINIENERHRVNMISLNEKQANAIVSKNEADRNHVEEMINLEDLRHKEELARIKQREQDEIIKNQNVVKGIQDAMTNINKAFEPYQMAQDAVLQTWGKIGNAVDTFIDTGKFKFSDFARSIVADLAKMITKALIFKYIFEPIMGSLDLPIPGMKAEGGPVKGNSPYIVGEKGPELFIPKNAGTVIPNNQLASASSNMAQPMSQPVVNNYTYNNNISAVDAKSVASLFYENRKSLFGASMAAQKELPYGARG